MLQLTWHSNEGFGLGTCESLMAGTPIIVNVTGGLQDQCGFRLKGKLLTAEDYKEIKSLHDDRKWAHNEDLTWGEWVKQYGHQTDVYKVLHRLRIFLMIDVGGMTLVIIYMNGI